MSIHDFMETRCMHYGNLTVVIAVGGNRVPQGDFLASNCTAHNFCTSQSRVTQLHDIDFLGVWFSSACYA